MHLFQVFGTDKTSWSGLGLAAALVSQLEGANFLAPTQVQQQAIPVMMAGRCEEGVKESCANKML